VLGIGNYFFSGTIQKIWNKRPTPTHSNFMNNVIKVLAQLLGKMLLLQIKFRTVLLLLSLLLSVLFGAK
jgi:hypothetical protein